VDRPTRSATNIIAAITALAWIIAVFAGQSDRAAYAMGFIPARLSGEAVPFAAVPAILTPLTATLVHSGLIHLGFNLLVFVWCGTAVERVLGKAIVPMVGASGAISAVVGAFALSFGRAKQVSRSPALNRWINVIWLLAAWIVLQMMMGWLAGGQGYLLATPAHVGGFAAGLLLQRPLLLWKYRKA
jgi:membrane associated rhomboid family serine protease